MLGVYCHAMFPDGTPRPMIIVPANQPGSGKSLLVRAILSPVYGAPAESGKPATEKDFERVLDSAALARKPYLVLDDCKESIESHALNRFVTSPVHECTLLFTQTFGTMPKVTQVFATGNGLVISEDLDRRALVIELFEAAEATNRSFTKDITPSWLVLPETRARFLAALWAMVRRWRDEGSPLMKEYRRGSFEEWSGVIGGMVIACGMTNPFTPRQSDSGGDEVGRAVRRLLALAAGESPDGKDFTTTTQGLLDLAEREGLLELLELSDKAPKLSLGRKLRNKGGGYLGRQFTDTRGRCFEFGKRDGSAGAIYPIRFL